MHCQAVHNDPSHFPLFRPMQSQLLRRFGRWQEQPEDRPRHVQPQRAGQQSQDDGMVTQWHGEHTFIPQLKFETQNIQKTLGVALSGPKEI